MRAQAWAAGMRAAKIGVQDLAKALGRSQGIVEKKSTMPILSHGDERLPAQRDHGMARADGEPQLLQDAPGSSSSASWAPLR